MNRVGGSMNAKKKQESTATSEWPFLYPEKEKEPG